MTTTSTAWPACSTWRRRPWRPWGALAATGGRGGEPAAARGGGGGRGIHARRVAGGEAGESRPGAGAGRVALSVDEAARRRRQAPTHQHIAHWREPVAE